MADQAPRIPDTPIPKEKPPKKEHENNKKVDDPYNKVRWQNRRRMAWTSLVCMIILTISLVIIAVFTDVDMSRLKTISEPLSWSYFGFTSVIGAYMGFTTWASKKGKR
jgi:hypothetical protein